jgi:hypothetical protein
MKRLLPGILLSIILILIIGLTLFFIFRNKLAEQSIAYKIEKFNASHELKVKIEEFRFKGLKTLHFDSISLMTAPGDTVLSISSLSANLSLLRIVIGQTHFKSLSVENARIKIIEDSLGTYRAAFAGKKGKKRSIADSSVLRLNAKAEHILMHVFTTIPSKFQLKNCEAIYLKDSVILSGLISNMQMKRGKFTTTARIVKNGKSQLIQISGRIRPPKRSIEIKITPITEQVRVNSVLSEVFGIKLNYKSLYVSFTERGKRGKELQLNGRYTLEEFVIDHKSLASKPLSFPDCDLSFDIAIGQDYLKIDSNSIVSLGKIKFQPYFKYTISEPESLFVFLNIPEFDVSDFYTSIPEDLFPHLKYFETHGNLSYRAKLIIDMDQPDSLQFYSYLNADKLAIENIDYELRKMNEGFVYTAYERGNPVRSFIVGPENPDFMALDELPVILQNAVLVAEDGSFYGHQGFLISAIKRAIAENIKTKKLYRGGSTISQQLIKNVYLSHDKTITRKIEEVILVWLIESHRLVSKKRMFEVYLNVIEWGPGIYGANQAAGFYFDKNVRQLNAEECIFLASVIPSPKKFYWRFDNSGQLEKYMLDYYRDIASKLKHKGILTTANGDSLASMLQINGYAKEYLKIKSQDADTIEDTDYAY